MTAKKTPAKKAAPSTVPELVELDLDELTPWVGVPHGGPQLKFPFHRSDFARWATHTDNYNPLHFDEQWAADSKHGEIIAPQSFTGLRAIGESMYTLPRQEVMPYHVGDEFFFYGPRVYDGDQFQIDRCIAGIKTAKTRFGPSAFVNVDLTHSSQRGFIVKRRATTMLSPIANMQSLGQDLIPGDAAEAPEWNEAMRADVDREKLAYITSIRTHAKRGYDSVKVGDELPVSVLGPHTGATFLYGEACGVDDTWGTVTLPDEPPTLPVNSYIGGERPGRDPQIDTDLALVRPLARGQFIMNEGHGGHIYDEAAAKTRGMPRAFAVGTMMSIWSVDYLSNWAGEWGFLRRSTIRYLSPVLAGDVTYISGTVTELNGITPNGSGSVTVNYSFRDQNGVTSCDGIGVIDLPLSSST